jgi:CRISPR/Cas system-associated protein Cas10 (large subunit of type III CRISPR-Cas system)
MELTIRDLKEYCMRLFSEKSNERREASKENSRYKIESLNFFNENGSTPHDYKYACFSSLSMHSSVEVVEFTFRLL